MPKSKNRRKNKKPFRNSFLAKKSGFYTGGSKRAVPVKKVPIPLVEKIVEPQKLVANNQIDFKQRVKDILLDNNASVLMVEKLQDMALSDALHRFNVQELIVPCDGISSLEEITLGGRVRAAYFTYYDTMKRVLFNKLNGFGLSFHFPKMVEVVDQISSLKQVKVTMRVTHELGGTLTIQSKPVMVTQKVINDVALDYDGCIASAVTKCKKDLLQNGGVFKCIINAPECYDDNARNLTMADFKCIGHQQIKEIEGRVFNGRIMHFIKYLEKQYNIKFLGDIRGHQYERILRDAKLFTIDEISLKERQDKTREKRWAKYRSRWVDSQKKKVKKVFKTGAC